MHTSPEPGAEVRGAGEDVAQMLIPHEFPTSLLNKMLHLKVNRKDYLYFRLFEHTKKDNCNRLWGGPYFLFSNVLFLLYIYFVLPAFKSTFKAIILQYFFTILYLALR